MAERVRNIPPNLYLWQQPCSTTCAYMNETFLCEVSIVCSKHISVCAMHVWSNLSKMFLSVPSVCSYTEALI